MRRCGLGECMGELETNTDICCFDYKFNKACEYVCEPFTENNLKCPDIITDEDVKEYMLKDLDEINDIEDLKNIIEFLCAGLKEEPLLTERMVKEFNLQNVVRKIDKIL